MIWEVRICENISDFTELLHCHISSTCVVEFSMRQRLLCLSVCLSLSLSLYLKKKKNTKRALFNRRQKGQGLKHPFGPMCALAWEQMNSCRLFGITITENPSWSSPSTTLVRKKKKRRKGSTSYRNIGRLNSGARSWSTFKEVRWTAS